MKLSLSRFLLFFLIAAVPIVAQERYVRPIDEAKLDPSLLAFRTKLIAAVERRDAKFIYGILDPQVKINFGGGQGVKDFKQTWALESADTKFWTEFLPVIKNGGAFLREKGKRSGKFFAPYTFASFPDDLDAFEHSMIFGNDVALRKSPNASSPIVAKLSYNVVKTDTEGVTPTPGSETIDWHSVETLGGLKGFVKQEYVRSSLDYRAGFEKKRGQWKMVLFVSGD